MRLSVITQITLHPSLLDKSTPDTPSGAIHLSVTPIFQDGADEFTGAPGDVTCANVELCERARTLAADLAAWYAADKQKATRLGTDATKAPILPPARVDGPALVVDAAERA